jgi:hypothetical protein
VRLCGGFLYVFKLASSTFELIMMLVIAGVRLTKQKASNHQWAILI